MDDTRRTRYAAALLPLLQEALGGVEVCDMSDATGFYQDGVLFALISGDTLHFRVDGHSRAEYDAWERQIAHDEGGGFPLTAGTASALKFRPVPPFVLDDVDLIARWGRKAVDAARRARTAGSPLPR